MEIHHRQDLLNWLEANAEPALVQFALPLIPGLQRKMWGIRIPKLRSLAKDLAKKDVHWVLNEVLSTASFEEVMLRGFVIGYARKEWDETWTEICNFVPLIDNWEICDCCCTSFTAVRTHREVVWPELVRYAYSCREYEQRFAVVMMMEHFLTDDYIDKVLTIWGAMTPAGYYATMAIGWGLSVSFLTYKNATMKVLQDERVPLVCRKKACQKILESKRTPDDCRSEIKALKSKY